MLCTLGRSARPVASLQKAVQAASHATVYYYHVPLRNNSNCQNTGCGYENLGANGIWGTETGEGENV